MRLVKVSMNGEDNRPDFPTGGEQGAASAFVDVLYRKYRDKLLGFLRSRKLSSEDAKDLFRGSLDLPENPSTSPERILESRESMNRFETGLKALSPRSRDVFVLHRYEGLTYSEIAQHCDITVSAVGKHMIKAIAHFEAWMGECK